MPSENIYCVLCFYSLYNLLCVKRQEIYDIYFSTNTFCNCTQLIYDPCWCGAIDPKTGKPYKYKKCGLINAPYHRG